MVETEYETMYLGAAGHADIQKGLSKRQTKLDLWQDIYMLVIKIKN